jgi:hypothetical protein
MSALFAGFWLLSNFNGAEDEQNILIIEILSFFKEFEKDYHKFNPKDTDKILSGFASLARQ